MEFKRRVNKHRVLAKHAMNKNEESRNNDWDLLFTVLDIIGLQLYPWQKNIIKNSGVNFHTLVRERRRLQKEFKEFRPTNPKVLRRRGLLEEEYKNYYSTK